MSQRKQTFAHPSQIPDGTPEHIKNRLKSILSDKRGQDGDTTPSKINKDLCELINEMYEQDMKASEIMKLIPATSQNTLYYHVRGDCEHEHREIVTFDECGWMRVYSRKGAKTSTLAILYNIHRRTVQKHLRGKCSHEQGIKPLTKQERRWNLHQCQ